MGELLMANPRALSRRVFPALRIDRAARKKMNTLFYKKDGETLRDTSAKEWQSINKGLSMELLSASLFSCLNHPAEVVSHCQLSKEGRHPQQCAGKDAADIEVDHGAFSLLAEVSVLRDVAPKDFEKQVTQAINHAKPRTEANPDKPVYALVINNGSVEYSADFRRAYTKLNASLSKSGDDKKGDENKKDEGGDKREEQKGGIRLIPIWARDFAEIVSVLCRHDHPVGLGFDAADLARALDTIHECFAIKGQWSKPGWARKAFLAVLAGEPVPLTDEEKAKEQAEAEQAGEQGDEPGEATTARPVPPAYPFMLTWRRSAETTESPAGQDLVVGDSMSLRKGLSGAFLDFDELRYLLPRVEGFDSPEEAIEDWADWLERHGFEQGHLDPDDLPPGVSAAQSIAADAFGFCRRMWYIDDSISLSLTRPGRRFAGFPDLKSNRPAEAPAPVLAEHIEDRLRGEGGDPILPLLRRAAISLAETESRWARECPGLLPCEVSAIVHWACIDIQRANRLVDNIVSNRESAMRGTQAPDPEDEPGDNADIHAQKVAEFYAERSWLGKAVIISSAAELAFCKLLAYCDLLLEAKYK